jgi:phage shock protein PspC (stress-responsive transcriptional regulator)
MILGVSDWLARKFNIEALYIRIGFVLTVLLGGSGILVYLILYLIKILKKE